MEALLALEDGRVFRGRSFGAPGERAGEIVFNTSMTGYQEILTDPSYKGQIVAMTYPLIGNYGVNDEDIESSKPQAEGFVVKEASKITSNWRSLKGLGEYLKEHNILGIEGVDTRALTRHIRTAGAMKSVLSTECLDEAVLVRKAQESPGLIGRDLVKEVTCQKLYQWSAVKEREKQSGLGIDTRNSKDNVVFRVVAIDCGIKTNILRMLDRSGCDVTVVPAHTGAEEILTLNPDGLFLSNGPGDPAGVPYVAETIRKLIGKKPIFGICLGHQILGIALGGKTYKLKFGHRGGNQPVKDLATGKVSITAQNHGFSVDIESLNKDEIELTHINLNDHTLEGMRHKTSPVFSVQHHPEARPAPMMPAISSVNLSVQWKGGRMPRRSDINKILIIGSGPIIISQACEFDYSGTQACKALKEDGFEVVLINSNPATIMTDPTVADRTYIEPITPEMVGKVIEKERPDALLPTLGGQTALNVALQVAESGVLDTYGVQMIGADQQAIKKAEDRNLFKEAMQRIGQDLPRSGLAYNMEQARKIAREIGYPLIIRSSFTLGGTGGGIAFNVEEFEAIASGGIECSMINEILIEESLLGWKEYELEVMRDIKDNVVIICSIENFDPMGIHTGDSITVAPAQTLTDREYQKMRDAAIDIIREIGVETGGSNIQFAVNPRDGRMVIIEMNPRVSRSSALASKATGFPIAKMAAKLAVGYTLDEIPNDITRETPASFEPTIDYCVVKIPRFTFEKFPKADPTLTIAMKSVGETMAIGRTFKEALQKGLRSLETGRYGLGADGKDAMFDTLNTLNEEGTESAENTRKKIVSGLSWPHAERIFYIRYAFQSGMSIEEVAELSSIDPWFLQNIKEIVDMEQEIVSYLSSKGFQSKSDRGPLFSSSISELSLPRDLLLKAKQYGFSDVQLAHLAGVDEITIRKMRKDKGVEAVFKLVDTCAAEFESYTPYYYSTYEEEDETRRTTHEKVMILGG